MRLLTIDKISDATGMVYAGRSDPDYQGVRAACKAQDKQTESDTLKKVGERLDSHELKHELREILRAVNSIRNFGMGTAYNEYVGKILALLRGEKPEGL